MAIDNQLLEQLRAGTYSKSSIILSNQKLTDEEVKELIGLLENNPRVTSLDLRNNQLTEKTVNLLADNKTLKSLRLKPGNPAIKLKQLHVFFYNYTLTELPFSGGGPKERELRAHIIANQTRKPPANSEETITIQETADAETGEASFSQLAYHLIFDLQDFKSAKEYVVWYMAITLNLYMHNASHKPMSDYGKVRQLEQEHPLYYARSQSKHPIRIQHDHFAKTSTDTRPTSVFPLNHELKKLILQTIVPADDDENDKDYIDDESTEVNQPANLSEKRKEIIRTLKAIDSKRGFPYKNKAIPDYSLFIAHGGLRVNNLRGLINALDGLKANDGDDIALLRQKFTAELTSGIPKNILKLDEIKLVKYIQAIQQRFANLQQEIQKPALHDQLQHKMQSHRLANNKLICDKANQNFTTLANNAIPFLSAEPNGQSCIIIRLNPNRFKFTSKTEAEHATNVVLSFLIGLINHHAQLKKLSVWVERRQSFGFLRTTLTDVGELGIRLSLGLEPAGFNEIVLASLNDLYTILATSNRSTKNFTRMKSEEKQWQAGFEAQYYLAQAFSENSENYLGTAFEQYIDNYASANQEIKKVSQPAELSKVSYPTKIESQGNFDQSPLFAVLQNLLSYALNFVNGFDGYNSDSSLKHFKHSYWHSLLKLYQHCHAAHVLLNTLDDYEVTAAYKMAATQVEDILEYLIALDSLKQIEAKLQGLKNDKIEKLTNTEKCHALSNFGLDSQQVTVYFTDSGQQAIATSLLAMDHQLSLTKAHATTGLNNIYNFNESYYELGLFLEDVGGLQNTNKATSTIAFIDVIQLNDLKFEQFPQLKALVIDLTRQPELNDPQLKQIVAEAHRRNIWIILASSCLKHDELGLDKYLAGKIIILAPSNTMELVSDVEEIFASVANHGFHPAIASYLQIVNEVCRDKIITSSQEKLKGSATALQQIGIFAQSQPRPESGNNQLSSSLPNENSSSKQALPANQNHQQLKQQAAEFGYNCIDVLGDGNCFFRAVEEQLERVLEIKLSHETLRAIAIDHIRHNLPLYKDSITGNVESFINKISRNGEWADHIVIQALSRALNISLFMIRDDGQAPTIIRQPNAFATVYLGYQVGIHYQSLSHNHRLNPTKKVVDYLAKATIDQVDHFNLTQTTIEARQLMQNIVYPMPTGSLKP